MNFKLIAGTVVLLLLFTACAVVLDTDSDVDAAETTVDGLVYESTGSEGKARVVGGVNGGTGLKDTVAIKNKVTIAGVDCDVVEIKSTAFKNCTAITRVNLPSTLETISSEAFSGCTKLDSLSCPSKLERIENKAFYGCIALKTVRLNNGLTSVGADAFNGCSAITSISFPNSVTTIEKDALKGCTKLTEVDFGTGLVSVGSEMGPKFLYPEGGDLIESASAFCDHHFKGTYTAGLKQQVRISFDTKGGDSLSPIYGEYNTTFSLPTPTKKYYTFDGWYSDSELSTKFTATKYPNEDITIYAKWKAIEVRSISLSTGSTATVGAGQSLDVTVITSPAGGYVTTEWVVEEGKEGIVSAYGDEDTGTIWGIAEGTAKVTVTANGDSTKRATVTVTVVEMHSVKVNNTDKNGTIAVDKSSAGTGQTVTITVSPNDNYQLKEFKKTPSTLTITKQSDNKYTFTMPKEDVTLEPVFELSDFKVTFDIDTSQGTIDGPTSIHKGGSATYSVVAKDNYIVSDIKVNNVSKGSNPVFKITNVTSSQTIKVTFESLQGAKSTKDSSGNVTVTFSKTVEGVTFDVSKKYKTDSSIEIGVSYKIDSNISVNGTVKVSGSSETGSVSVVYKLDGNNVSSDNYQKAQNAAKKVTEIAGHTSAKVSQSIKFDAKTESGESDGFSVTMDLSKYDGSTTMSFVSDTGGLSLDSTALTELVKGGTSAKFSVMFKDEKHLSKVQKWIAEENPVYDVVITANNKSPEALAGKVTLTLPYELPEGKAASSIKLYYIAAKEAEAQEKTVTYNSSTKTASTDLAHASLYFFAADYVAPDPSTMPSDSITAFIMAPIIIVLFILTLLFVFKFDLENKRLNIDFKIPFGKNKGGYQY